MTDSQINDTLSVHETLDFIGEHLFAEEWENGDWQAYFWPADTSSLGLGDQKPWTNEECAQNNRAQQVVSLFVRLAHNGVLRPYSVNGTLKDYLSHEQWGPEAFSIGKGIIQSGVRKKFQHDKNSITVSVKIDRDNLDKVLVDIPKRQSKNVGGRPEKFNYGKLTAVAWAILEDDNLIDRSATLSSLIIDVYRVLFPKDDLPSVDSLEDKITRDWLTYKKDAQAAYRKINKERGLETAG